MTTTIDVKNEEIIKENYSELHIINDAIDRINIAIGKMENDVKQFRREEKYTTANNLCKYIQGLQMAKRNIVASLDEAGIQGLNRNWERVE
ncbi:hypothetical protein [Pseudogracilibacillus sp. SO10305]|uniref:hypothetical protein n=1 Tax=Pseudogracilibacillus sp. SO10305 TaxID=3098292 RepID=UPI00300DDE8D